MLFEDCGDPGMQYSGSSYAMRFLGFIIEEGARTGRRKWSLLVCLPSRDLVYERLEIGREIGWKIFEVEVQSRFTVIQAGGADWPGSLMNRSTDTDHCSITLALRSQTQKDRNCLSKE